MKCVCGGKVVLNEINKIYTCVDCFREYTIGQLKEDKNANN